MYGWSNEVSENVVKKGIFRRAEKMEITWLSVCRRSGTGEWEETLSGMSESFVEVSEKGCLKVIQMRVR